MEEIQTHDNDAPAAPRHGRDLTTGSIPRLLVLFSLPMLAGSVLQTAYSIVNAIWVGQFLGKAALAAVSVSFPVFFIIMALAIGLTTGASILTAQYAGAHHRHGLRQVVQTSVVLMAIMSLLLFVIGELAAGPILRAMRTPADVLPMATLYLRIFLFAVPMNFGIFLVVSLLRGIGDATTPLYFQAIFLVVNAALDPVLMFGWLGLPAMGVHGTAVATVFTQAAALVAVFIYLHRKDHIIAPDWRRLRADWPTGSLLLKIGLPVAVQQVLISLGMAFVTGMVNTFGEDATAAFGAAMRIDMFAFMPAMTFSAAISALAGQNIGAKRYARVREIFWWGITLSAGITLLVSLVAFAYPDQLVGIFINRTRDAGALGIGISYLHIVSVGYVLMAILFASNGVITGAGHTMVTTVISLVALWAGRVPLAWLFSQCPVVDGRLQLHLYGWTASLPAPAPLLPFLHRVEGIWLAVTIGLGMGAAMSLVYFFSGRWTRAVVRQAPARPAPHEAEAPDMRAARQMPQPEVE